jgi:hypothetical protein
MSAYDIETTLAAGPALAVANASMVEAGNARLAPACLSAVDARKQWVGFTSTAPIIAQRTSPRIFARGSFGVFDPDA